MKACYILEAALLALSVCGDTFVSAVTYGARRIRIPLLSGLILAGVGSAVLACSAWVGTALRGEAARYVSFAVLLCLGGARLCDSALKGWIRRRQGHGAVKFTAFRLHFLLEVYADPELADLDSGGVLSAKEALLLGAVLSLDGAAAGFGAGAGAAAASVLLAAGLSLALSLGAIFAGEAVGKLTAEKAGIDLSPAGGALLVLLAFMKLLK